MELIEQEFLPSFSEGFKAAYLGSVYQWAKENVVLPTDYAVPGSFDASTSRYLIGPLDALKDPHVRQVNVMASPRSGKTLLAELFLLYTIANNPGPFLWVQSSDEQMGKMDDLRMGKLLRLCQPVRDLIDTSRYAITKQRYKFLNGMSVQLGSAKIRDLQGVGYKFIVGDETWLWDKGSECGLIAEAQARVGDFLDTSKILLISQGGIAGDEWSIEFDRGLIYEWGWVCPSCSGEQIYHFNFERPKGGYAGLVWERNEVTYPNEQWNINEAAKTAKLVCLHCGHKVEDTPLNREKLNATGKYICTKKDGDPTKLSFRWNALANTKVSFADLAREYLYADSILDLSGDNHLKKVFEQKRLARSHGQSRICDTVHVSLETYDPTLDWKEERVRFMTVDVQRKSPRFWYVIRAWSNTGQSRKIVEGYVDTWEDLESVQLKYKVKYNRVFVDAGDGQKEQEILNECAKHGKWIKHLGKDVYLCWIAIHAVNSKEFKHRGKDGPVTYPYGAEERKAVQLGNDAKYRNIKTCPYYVWSSLRIRDMLAHLISGKGPAWLASEASEEYKRHLASEQRTAHFKNGKVEYTWDKVTPDARNEWRDCEAMQVFAASVNKILSIDPPKQAEPLKMAA